jgi:hypothetical protein
LGIPNSPSTPDRDPVGAAAPSGPSRTTTASGCQPSQPTHWHRTPVGCRLRRRAGKVPLRPQADLTHPPGRGSPFTPTGRLPPPDGLAAYLGQWLPGPKALLHAALLLTGRGLTSYRASRPTTHVPHTSVLPVNNGMGLCPLGNRLPQYVLPQEANHRTTSTMESRNRLLDPTTEGSCLLLPPPWLLQEANQRTTSTLESRNHLHDSHEAGWRRRASIAPLLTTQAVGPCTEPVAIRVNRPPPTRASMPALILLSHGRHSRTGIGRKHLHSGITSRGSAYRYCLP